MTRQTIPATQNEGWGFWGTMNEHAAAAWPLAMQAVADATGEDLEAVRAFLDGCAGRHYADEVQDGICGGKSLADAIDAVTRKWMGWTISRGTSRSQGIPRGLPYLTGFVIQAAINAQLEAA